MAVPKPKGLRRLVLALLQLIAQSALQLHLRSYLVLACWWRHPEGKWTRRGRLAAPATALCI